MHNSKYNREYTFSKQSRNNLDSKESKNNLEKELLIKNNDSVQERNI